MSTITKNQIKTFFTKLEKGEHVIHINDLSHFKNIIRDRELDILVQKLVEKKTYRAIGQGQDVSGARIRQLYEKALYLLRKEAGIPDPRELAHKRKWEERERMKKKHLPLFLKKIEQRTSQELIEHFNFIRPLVPFIGLKTLQQRIVEKLSWEQIAKLRGKTRAEVQANYFETLNHLQELNDANTKS